jgi:hypothetical protein
MLLYAFVEPFRRAALQIAHGKMSESGIRFLDSSQAWDVRAFAGWEGALLFRTHR